MCLRDVKNRMRMIVAAKWMFLKLFSTFWMKMAYERTTSPRVTHNSSRHVHQLNTYCSTAAHCPHGKFHKIKILNDKTDSELFASSENSFFKKKIGTWNSTRWIVAPIWNDISSGTTRKCAVEKLAKDVECRKGCHVAGHLDRTERFCANEDLHTWKLIQWIHWFVIVLYFSQFLFQKVKI